MTLKKIRKGSYATLIDNQRIAVQRDLEMVRSFLCPNSKDQPDIRDATTALHSDMQAFRDLAGTQFDKVLPEEMRNELGFLLRVIGDAAVLLDCAREVVEGLEDKEEVQADM